MLALRASFSNLGTSISTPKCCGSGQWGPVVWMGCVQTLRSVNTNGVDAIRPVIICCFLAVDRQ
jgi:hypothetical protein